MRNLCGRVSAWRLQFFWFTPNMFSSLSSSFNSFGVVNGTLYLVGRVLQALSCGRARLIRYYIVAQPVPNPFVPMCKLSETERVHEAGLESPLVGFFPRPQEVVRSRFQRGHVCLVATSKDRFAGFLWFARELYDEDEVHCRFVLTEPGSGVWDYDVHVEPHFRLGRTFARLWDATNERLSASGVQWTFSRISAFNRQSLQSHQRLGTRKMYTLTFICLGAFQLSLMSCKPYVNFSWKGRGCPTVVVYPPSGT